MHTAGAQFLAPLERVPDVIQLASQTYSLSDEQFAALTKEAELPKIWHLFGTEAALQRFLLLAKMLERTTSRQLQLEHGMTVAQWRVLCYICMAGPSKACEISEAGEVDQAEISRAVRALQDEGLVMREFAPGNRKTMLITPTDQGKEIYHTYLARRHAYFASVSSGVTHDDMEAMERAMTSIAQEVVRQRKRSS